MLLRGMETGKGEGKTDVGKVDPDVRKGKLRKGLPRSEKGKLMLKWGKLMIGSPTAFTVCFETGSLKSS